MTQAAVILSIVCLAFPAAMETKAKFTTTWKSPGISGFTFAGRRSSD
jgi:hypothetical protein